MRYNIHVYSQSRVSRCREKEKADREKKEREEGARKEVETIKIARWKRVWCNYYPRLAILGPGTNDQPRPR